MNERVELDPQERESIVKTVAEVIGILTTTNSEYLKALASVARHLRDDHGYDVPSAIEATSLITSDALRKIADISHEAAMRAANDKRQAG